MMRVLVTGADGFVGTAVCRALAEADHRVVAATRKGIGAPGVDEARRLADLADLRDPDGLVRGVDAIVHLAARVHMMDNCANEPLAEYRRVNVEGTRRLAEAAARAGVKRLVFLSSIKVNGERTTGRPFTEDDAPDPRDPYGQAKWEAEQQLAGIADRAGLEVVILRAPLVYGPGVKANFLSLIALCDTALPLPFGAITHNRRSLLYVRNLADAIRAALSHPGAAGQTFLVSDGAPVSTAALVRELRLALGRPVRLLPVPPELLRSAMSALGRASEAGRLLDSLVVDASRIHEALGWHVPWARQAGLLDTASWYGEERATARTRRHEQPPGR